MDYVKDTGLRLVLYVLVILALFAYAVWARADTLGQMTMAA